MNAKEELLEVVRENNLEILSIQCCDERGYFHYNDGQLFTDLDSLDFDYDDGYGRQELFGEVYCLDKNTHELVWLTRDEYDGSEWWNVNRIPKFYLERMSFDTILEANWDVLERLKEKGD